MSYNLTKVAEYIMCDNKDLDLDDPERSKSKYIRMRELFMECGIIRKGILTDGHIKVGKWILTDEFKKFYSYEANMYFDEIITRNGYYQLKITEEGVLNLGKFIVNELGKELF